MIKQQRVVLYLSILASFVAFLDSSVVTVALPAISHELGGGLSAQQWIVDSYLITLGALILLAGSLSDLFGRKRIMTAGLVGFGITSLLCAIAPNSVFLILSRGLQGIAGALLVPSSLALLIATFSGQQQSKAIGSWTAWTGISFVVGPLLGGFLVDSSSWRFIFVINILPIVVCLWLLRGITVDKITKNVQLDLRGAILCSLGLAASVFSLIEQARYGWSNPLIIINALGGLGLLFIFIITEHTRTNAMLPLTLFRVRNFSVGNIATAAIYGGLSIATFLIAIFLQQVSGYSALAAGMALLPTTIIMFFLSSRFGALAGRYGPRLFMSLGPITAGIGFLLMLRVTSTTNYWTTLFPAVLVFALGLSMTVAPLTSAILSNINPAQAGVASATNNAVSRIAGLVAIALVGVIIGPKLTVDSFHSALVATAILVTSGGVISAFGIQNTVIKNTVKRI